MMVSPNHHVVSSVIEFVGWAGSPAIAHGYHHQFINIIIVIPLHPTSEQRPLKSEHVLHVYLQSASVEFCLRITRYF